MDSVGVLDAAMTALAGAVELPPIPKQPEVIERSETARPLVDSDWGYLGMVKALKARKQYEKRGLTSIEAQTRRKHLLDQPDDGH